MNHRPMDVTLAPPMRLLRPRTPRDDRLLRAHDVRCVVACLSLVAEELTLAGGRDAVLGNRVARACGRLLDLADPAHGRAPRRREATLDIVLDDVAALAGALAGPRTRLRVRCEARIRCGATETELYRILVNLTANAVRAVNESGGGTVTVSARRGAAERVCIRIADEGAGLIPATRRPSRPRTGRSGLGLVIAEALTTALGGTLTLVRSAPGGTSLHVMLPEAALAQQG